MQVKHNISGTMAASFSIGKNGPTVHQGANVPLIGLGNNGDIYIKHGTSPALFFRRATGWTLIETDLILETVSTSTHTLNSDTNYVIVTPASGGTTITLAPGITGKHLVIKDRGGAGTDNITITPDGSETIDGASTYTVNSDNGAISMIFINDEWIITSKV